MHLLSIKPKNKTNKEIISELIEIIFEKFGEMSGGNALLLMPVINMAKLKASNLEEKDCDELVDTVHKISRMIETETGNLSPYHGIE